jgi:hypothetical protein
LLLNIQLLYNSYKYICGVFKGIICFLIKEGIDVIVDEQQSHLGLEVNTVLQRGGYLGKF